MTAPFDPEADESLAECVDCLTVMPCEEGTYEYVCGWRKEFVCRECMAERDDLTIDQYLDDPRRGQAEWINAQNRGRS